MTSTEKRRLTRLDIVVLTVSALVFIAASVLLYLEVRRPPSGSAGRAIGEITYRNRIAQRRDAGRVLWDDLNSGDAVFDGDSVRTDVSAEALIELADGSKIELDPESLIVLSLRDVAGVRLVRGSMILRPGKRGATFEHDGHVYRAEGDSLRISGDEKEAEVESGDASSLRLPDGTALLRPEESATLRDGKETHLHRDLRPIAPVDNARFFIAKGGRVEVDFKWAGVVEGGSLELRKGALQAPVASTPVVGKEATLSLGEGSYFWQIRRGEQSSPLRRFRIREKEIPLLLLPAPDAILHAPGDSLTVTFRWKEHELASSYYFEVARDQGFTDRVAYETVQRTGISLPLVPGRYYWRVMVKGAVPGVESESAAQSFTVLASREVPNQSATNGSAEPDRPDAGRSEKPAEGGQQSAPGDLSTVKKSAVPARPVLLFPSPGTVVDMTGVNALLFRWSGDGSLERALVLRDGRSGRVVFQTRVRGNSFALTDLTVLDTGPFEWALDDGGTWIRARFTIVLRETLEKPRLEVR